MKVFIDSPLLIYLNSLANSGVRVVYGDFYIDVLVKYKPYTDVIVLDELLYVSKKKYNVPYSVTLEFIRSSILPYIHILNLGEEEFRIAEEQLEKHGLKPSDALHLGAMMNNNISVRVSEDREFDKIPGIRRLWIPQ